MTLYVVFIYMSTIESVYYNTIKIMTVVTS